MSTKRTRKDTKLESEGTEFLVLGRLLLEKITAFKTYTNFPGYDIIATSAENKRYRNVFLIASNPSSSPGPSDRRPRSRRGMPTTAEIFFRAIVGGGKRVFNHSRRAC